ncbi:MAG: type sorting protein [Ignavibacteria bacterium]|nr:type sorting protein [Ignavibacteria bacterium]
MNKFAVICPEKMNCRIIITSVFILINLLYSLEVRCQYSLNKIELIKNGDFEKDNIEFLSDYLYTTSLLSVDGYYSITRNPNTIYDAFASCSDHTSGSGNMLAANGSSKKGDSLWMQTVENLLPNSDYLFSFYAASLVNKRPPVFEIFINGNKLPLELVCKAVTCFWNKYECSWNSGTYTNATISILDKSIELDGNDFAIDDISLREICNIEVSVSNDTSICEGEKLQLQSSVIKGNPPYTYSWFPQSGVDNPFISNPNMTTNASSTFILTVNDAHDCFVIDTVQVNVQKREIFSISSNKSTALCTCDSLILSVPQGYNYLWSTGGIKNSIIVKKPGKYAVNIARNDICTFITSIDVTNISSTITYEVGRTHAKDGDSVIIPITVTNSGQSNDCRNPDYSLLLRFDNSILTPIKSTPNGYRTGSDRIIRLDFDSSIAQKDMEFIASLGSSTCTELTIDSLISLCPDIKTKKYNGRFCLDEICIQPQPRLFLDSGTVFLLPCHPNPVNNESVIRFGVVESGRTNLSLYNIFGEKVATIFDKQVSVGIFEAGFVANYLPDGIYFCVMQTPSQRFSNKLIISH